MGWSLERDPGEAAAIGISFAPNLEVPAEHAGEAKTPGSLGVCSSRGRKGLMSGSGQHTGCRPYDALSHLDSFKVHIGFVSQTSKLRFRGRVPFPGFLVHQWQSLCPAPLPKGQQRVPGMTKSNLT